MISNKSSIRPELELANQREKLGPSKPEARSKSQPMPWFSTYNENQEESSSGHLQVTKHITNGKRQVRALDQEEKYTAGKHSSKRS